MTMSADNTTAPAAVVDLLTSLLESTVNSIFRFMGEGSPYLSRAGAEVRRPLIDMVTANYRRASELAAMLETLGAPTTVHPSPRNDEQYLAFLSLKFLLPKLVEEKKLCLARYENALTAATGLQQTPPAVVAMLAAHRDEQMRELAALEHAAAQVAAKSAAAKIAAAKVSAQPPK
jgi:hypothetical protein